MEAPSLENTLKWLRIYHVVVFVYSILMSLFVGFLVVIFINDSSAFDSRMEYNFYMVLMGGISLMIFASSFIHLFAAVITKKKGQVNWIFQLILVIMGVTNMLSLIPCIFLFMGLTSEEGKDYYLK